MAAHKPKADRQVRQVREALISHYLPDHPRAQIDVYRYNDNSIRIRILDPSFAKVSRPRRTDHILAVLERLPDELVSQIEMILPLAPKEAKDSASNDEFEYPSPPPPPKVHWTAWVAHQHYPAESVPASQRRNGRGVRTIPMRVHD
jgi:hypothetical protein